MELNLWRSVWERTYVHLIGVMREGCPKGWGARDGNAERTVRTGCVVVDQKPDRAGPSRTLRSSERIAAKITDAGQEARRQAKTIVVRTAV